MDLCLRLQVFLQGPEWQFKGWDLSCYGGKMVNMFQRVCAFHVVERERGMVAGLNSHRTGGVAAVARVVRWVDDSDPAQPLRAGVWAHARARHHLQGVHVPAVGVLLELDQHPCWDQRPRGRTIVHHRLRGTDPQPQQSG